nr:unnamed protein product [Spirometra erinaceieuropaei]
MAFRASSIDVLNSYPLTSVHPQRRPSPNPTPRRFHRSQLLTSYLYCLPRHRAWNSQPYRRPDRADYRHAGAQASLWRLADSMRLL